MESLITERKPDAVKELCSKGGKITLEPRSVFYGEPDSVVLLTSGIVMVSASSPKAMTRTVDVVKATTLPLGILEGQDNLFIEPLTKCRITTLCRDDLFEASRQDPEVSLWILQQLTYRKRALEDCLYQTRNNVIGRIAWSILKFYSVFNDNPLPVTQLDISNLAGCVRESANITIANLRKQAIITATPKKIGITDIEKLRLYADQKLVPSHCPGKRYQTEPED